MNLRKRLWLLRYYAYNAVYSKVGGLLGARGMQRFSDEWDAVRAEVGPIDEMLVVGNGPSLTADDLTCLSEVPSIASNKIDLIFDQTPWRPTLYTTCDAVLAYKLRRQDFRQFGRVLCPHTIRPMLPRAHTLPWLGVPRSVAEEGEFRPDPVHGIFDGHTITVQNIQLALWLGASRIYLIGCDHFYTEPEHAAIGKKLSSAGGSHFHPNYRANNEIVNNASVGQMDISYAVVHTVAKEAGAVVLNISRKSNLTVFPRASVEEVLEAHAGRDDPRNDHDGAHAT